MKNVYVISLGCDKNRVDTETMLYELSENGFGFCGSIEEAQFAIVNTCAFLNSAREEAINTIFDVADFKERGLEKLVVTGCLPQRFLSDMVEGLPEVDAFLGTDSYGALPSVLKSLYEGERVTNVLPCAASGKRLLTTMPHYAYVKIADGCNNFCSYCLIPSIRGRYRSRTMESVVEECTSLVSSGVKELIFVAQDTTRYGLDLYGKAVLPELIEKISQTEVEQIRLLYCYPELVTPELISVIANNPKVCKYIDVPLQHVSDNVLRGMNRRSNKQQIVKLITDLRSACPDIAIRSTFILGFPNESEADVFELEEFLREFRLERVGFFGYSREEGTPAADMEQVDSEVITERVNRLAAVQSEISLEKNRAKVGTRVKVRYEDIDYKRNMFVGRTAQDAPDVDGCVYFTADSVEVGEWYEVLITDCTAYDLEGKL